MTKESRNSAVTESPSPFPIEDQIEANHDINFDISLDNNVASQVRDITSYSNFDNQSSVEKETDSSNHSSYTLKVIHACSSRYCAFFSEKSECEHC